MAFLFEKLEVYQKAVTFAERVSSLTEEFPRGHWYLADHLNRASLSISLNIAEGNGRWTATPDPRGPRGRRAPTGRKMKAQGEALGKRPPPPPRRSTSAGWEVLLPIIAPGRKGGWRRWSAVPFPRRHPIHTLCCYGATRETPP